MLVEKESIHPKEPFLAPNILNIVPLIASEILPQEKLPAINIIPKESLIDSEILSKEPLNAPNILSEEPLIDSEKLPKEIHLASETQLKRKNPFLPKIQNDE